MSFNQHTLSTASVLALAIMAASPAAAQETVAAGNDPAPQEASAADAGDIVVTAQKRSERLLDVPISISAYSAETLRESKVDDITSLPLISPSLGVSTSTPPSLGASFRIRGVGTSSQNTGLESAVGFFIDGVYRSRSGTALGDLVDVERIEVLKGPQGTLFGKNTSAGAISVITAVPDLNRTIFYGEGTLTSLGGYTARGSINLPIIDGKAGIRIAGSYNKRDGIIDDIGNGREYNDRNRWAVRVQGLANLTDTLSIRVVGDYAKANEICCQTVTSFQNPLTAGFIATLAAANGGGFIANLNPNRYETAADRPVVDNYEDRGVSAEVNWNLGAANLVSITAYRRFNDLNLNDIDFSAADLLYRSSAFSTKTFTEELRLQGRSTLSDSLKLDWLVGGFYINESIRRVDQFSLGNQIGILAPVLVSGGAFAQDARQTEHSYAIFTHNVLSLSDKLFLTGGLRYTSVKKSGSSTFAVQQPIAAFIFGVSPNFSQSKTENAWSGTANLRYAWTDNINSYVSYSRGYKSGGINLDFASVPPNNDRAFAPETANSYEIGTKGRISKEFSFGLVLFRTDFKNFQLQSFNGTNFTLRNISGVRTQGVEFDANIALADFIDVTAGVAYTDAKFNKDVTDRPSPVLPPFGGRTLPDAPRWSVNLVTNVHDHLTSTIDWFARSDVFLRSDANSGGLLVAHQEQDGFVTLGLRAGIKTADGRWELAGFCRNCTNVTRLSTVFVTPFQANDANPNAGTFVGFPNDPREYGLTATVRF